MLKICVTLITLICVLCLGLSTLQAQPYPCGQLGSDYLNNVGYGTHGGKEIRVEFRAVGHTCYMDVLFYSDQRQDSYQITPKGSAAFRAQSLGPTRFGKYGCWSTLRSTRYGVSGLLCGAKMILRPDTGH